MTFFRVRGKIAKRSFPDLTVKCQKLFSVIPGINDWQHVERFHRTPLFWILCSTLRYFGCKIWAPSKETILRTSKEKKIIFFCYFVVLSKKMLKHFEEKYLFFTYHYASFCLQKYVRVNMLQLEICKHWNPSVGISSLIRKYQTTERRCCFWSFTLPLETLKGKTPLKS